MGPMSNVETHLPDLYHSLYQIADSYPDTGEGGRWHLATDYVRGLTEDHRECVESGDTEGAHDCNADALDVLHKWTEA